MQTFIISDQETIALRVRQVLLGQGHHCPLGHVLTLNLGGDNLPSNETDLVLIVLSPCPERALEVLTKLRSELPATASILAVGPTQDARLVMQAHRSGAADFVDEAEVESDLPDALRRFAIGQANQGEPGRLIAVLAPSGGSGASTLAANVATVFAREQKKVLLIDLSQGTGDLPALLNLKPSYTLADLCLNAERLDRTMFERSLVQHSSGVQLLAPPQNFADLDQITPEGVQQTLAMARALFPYVVVDLDFSFREEEARVLRQADIVLLVLRLDFSSLHRSQRVLDFLKHLEVNPDKVRVVVNRYGQPKEVPAAKAQEALGVRICHYVPEDAKAVNRANNAGVPLVLENPRAKVARSMITLAHSLNGRT